MEIEVSAEAKDKRLNRHVAITVVVLSVATGLCNIKDGNIVQAMAQAQSSSVDLWNEYQATKTKQHLAETSRAQIAAVSALAESGWLLAVAWVLGAIGLFLGLCGFAGWSFHPAVLSTLLG
ncbi:DUF4337 family protein [Sphingomonas elodea]|uniref:DUF4337 family protein n=1 Tax=Sphingomonas elodea TaxID=179878 RepID=UPI00026312F1|nr:DUF4337 family protein [Sphingomonas elodea]